MSNVTGHEGTGSVDKTPGGESPAAMTSDPAWNRLATMTVSVTTSLVGGYRSYT